MEVTSKNPKPATIEKVQKIEQLRMRMKHGTAGSYSLLARSPMLSYSSQCCRESIGNSLAAFYIRSQRSSWYV
jgi:hypothetical protein